ncbi:hypothetical protein, partial [Actinobacillus pleuropneumoniae]|uniref:hypothetical protein n=1 Tax=Actinobacillus pleuropneumoniae TaxID=715 RepID=UPI001EE674FB
MPLRRSGSEAQREDRPYMYFPFLCNKSDLSLTLLSDAEYKKIYDGSKFNDSYVNELKSKYEENG